MSQNPRPVSMSDSPATHHDLPDNQRRDPASSTVPDLPRRHDRPERAVCQPTCMTRMMSALLTGGDGRRVRCAVVTFSAPVLSSVHVTLRLRRIMQYSQPSSHEQSCAIQRRVSRLVCSTPCEPSLTLVSLILSRTPLLISGIRPKRCAMNSSGRGLLFWLYDT
jgi:hypothetical protein